MDNIIQVFYEFQNTTGILIANETTKLKVVIICNQALGFNTLNFHLKYDITGKLNTTSEIPVSVELDSQKTWNKDSTHEYKIEFKTPNTPISFSGDNLEIVWYVITELVVDEATKQQIRGLLLKKTKQVQLASTYNGKIITKQPIQLSNKVSDYQIIDFNELTYRGIHIPLLFGIFILGTDILLYISGSYHIVISSIAAIVGIGLLGYALYKYLTIGLLGKVTLLGKYEDEEKFRICVIPEKNIKKIMSITLFYTINEEVVDNRGSASEILQEKIFESKDYTVRPPFNSEICAKLEYPNKTYPTYFKHSAARIYWQLHVKFEFKNGLSSSIKHEFKVF